MANLDGFSIYTINYWMLIPAVCIIFLLSFLEKRKNRQDICNGRPALLIFLDGFENRTAYAMAFGTATSTVVSLIKSDHTLEFDFPLWATALYVYLQAIIGCLTCFPLFACLTTRYRALGAILCMLYSLMWLAVKFVQVIKDVESDSILSDALYQNDTISLNTMKAYDVLQSLPIIFCYIVLILYCFYILRRCYMTKTYFIKHMAGTVRLHQEEHVRWVFRKFPVNFKGQDSVMNRSGESQTFIEQMKHSIKLRYFTSFPFFRYPARIYALSFVQLNILYWTGLLLMMITMLILYPFIYANITKQFLPQFEVDILVICSVCSVIALLASVFNALTQIFVSVRNYRFDMLRIYQGRKNFDIVSNKTPQNILTRSMTFPGYQMAFMLWGIILCFTTVFLLTCLPIMLLYITAKLDMLGALALNLVQVLSFPATVFALFYLQVFMTKKVLLQKKVKETDVNPPLNVNNRKFYEIVNYYSLFTNMAVGLLTCLFRIIQSAFYGIFSIARLDRSVFPRRIETWDRGYMAYISMLLVDNAHNNPCMCVFAHLLWTKVVATRLRRHPANVDSSDELLLIPNHQSRHGRNIQASESPLLSEQSGQPWIFVETPEIHRRNQAHVRWLMFYTLINNPQLCHCRKHKLARTYNSSMTKASARGTVESFNKRENEDSPLLDLDNSASYS